jgi:hypothetical protein
MDESFIERHACSYFKRDKVAARRAVLSIAIKARGEAVTEAAIAAEALAEDARALVVRDVLYPSILAVAMAYDLNDDSIRSRMERKGETLNAAFGAMLKRAEGFVVHGKRYPSIAATARAYGLNAGSARWRVDEFGETMEQAIDALLKHADGVIVHGVRYPSIMAAARVYGVHGITAALRVREKDETAEQAIDAIVTRAEHRAVIVLGVAYPSGTAAARAHGVSASAVGERRRKQGETAEQAINALVEYARKGVVVHGKRYRSALAAAKAYGCRSGVLRRMQRKGETAETRSTRAPKASSCMASGIQALTRQRERMA